MLPPTPRLATDLRRAFDLHIQGDLVQAGRAYRSVLAREPANFEALRLMALVSHQLERLPEALTYGGRAIAVSADVAVVHVSRADALAGLGRQKAALLQL